MAPRTCRGLRDHPRRPGAPEEMRPLRRQAHPSARRLSREARDVLESRQDIVVVALDRRLRPEREMVERARRVCRGWRGRSPRGRTEGSRGRRGPGERAGCSGVLQPDRRGPLKPRGVSRSSRRQECGWRSTAPHVSSPRRRRWRTSSIGSSARTGCSAGPDDGAIGLAHCARILDESLIRRVERGTPVAPLAERR